ncbi:ATP-binding protein [Henriciella sp. AS95]|uniref:sensor histidine kinase n=1 Tax=Henriciella sp. AS95 TaxID=3135782 RepID=UPI0031787A05
MSVKPEAATWMMMLFHKLPVPQKGTEERVYAEMQRLLLKLLVPMALISAFNGLIYCAAFVQYVELWKLVVWYIPVAFFSAMQIFASVRLKKRANPARASVRLLRKAEFSTVVVGVVWGLSALLFRSENELANLFICVVIAGMGAGTMSILGPVSRIGGRFLISSTLVMMAVIIAMDSPFALQVSLLALSFMAALLIGGLRNYRHVFEMMDQSIQSESAREKLTDAIDSSNDAFAFYDDENQLLLANKRHKDWFGVERPDFASGEESVPVLLKSGRWLMRSTRETGQGGVVVVHTDITALKTRERELIEAQREAVEADAAKSRFLSTMSHELRTPMNIILGFSKLMTGDSKLRLSNEEIREYADNIHASGTHLLRLINDIIDYSKVGLDRIAINPKRIETKALLSEAITLAAGFENKSTLDSFDVAVSAKLSDLMVDETAIKRILINLMTNAIRFNRSDKKVVVRAGLDSSGIPFIAIRDFGRGIPENKMERVFEAFYQGDNDLDRSHGGTGLGLTLCRHLARLMAGDVILKSRVGVGTTAVLTLPKSVLLESGNDDAGAITDDVAAERNVA